MLVGDHGDDLLGELGVGVGEEDFEARGFGGGEFTVDVGGDAGFEFFGGFAHEVPS